jgi:trans-aconitate methyltransferase
MNPDARPACTPDAFEKRYLQQPDPWQFRTSVYERSRYGATLRALPPHRYAFAFEPGCSIGELTVLLALRCDRVFATDVSPTAVERASRRCESFPHVRVECRDLRDTVLRTSPDLILMSEIAYYFEPRELESLARRLGETLCVGGSLIAVHWLGESEDHVLRGDEAHEILLHALPLRHEGGERHPGFRIDRWSRS